MLTSTPKTKLSPRSAALPFVAIDPIPPSYSLAQTVELLGLKSPQAFRQSGLESSITSYLLSASEHTARGVRVYDAAEVQAWALRLARLRLAQRSGEIRNSRFPLLEAPADADHDALCPKCGAFARRGAKGSILCLHGHRTSPPS